MLSFIKYYLKRHQVIKKAITPRLLQYLVYKCNGDIGCLRTTQTICYFPFSVLPSEFASHFLSTIHQFIVLLLKKK